MKSPLHWPEFDGKSNARRQASYDSLDGRFAESELSSTVRRNHLSRSFPSQTHAGYEADCSCTVHSHFAEALELPRVEVRLDDEPTSCCHPSTSCNCKMPPTSQKGSVRRL